MNSDFPWQQFDCSKFKRMTTQFVNDGMKYSLSNLRHDKVITDDPAEGRSGKSFDDCLDSFLSLTAVVAFVDGIAHVHQGNDPSDGHIVGPGLPKLTKQNDGAKEVRT
jgi:hypothetical protein